MTFLLALGLMLLAWILLSAFAIATYRLLLSLYDWLAERYAW